MRRHLRAQIRIAKRRLKRFVVHTVLHADDPPERIARGVAIAVFISFTPTVGIQMLLALFFAWLFRANKAVGIPIVWVSNPATIVPIYYMCYWIGRTALRLEGVGMQWWAELTHPPLAWWPRVTFYWDKFMEIFTPLWVGSLIVAGILGYVSYYVTYYAICGYRMKRWGQLMPPTQTIHAKPTAAASKPSV